MADTTIRLTVAQAITRWLDEPVSSRSTAPARGSAAAASASSAMATCPASARRSIPAQGQMPLYRGQNEQSMGFAAAAYAKYHLRRRFMFCTASPRGRARPIC
jgi:3D-(3,5/4)-trihydroxycyclohexane-1,2-dione acylhydrolase (decyclizing)